jgi:hypothetical protein
LEADLEVDCIRAVGGNTAVSIWIEGKLRALTVASRLIDPLIPAPATDADRCRLVASHLQLFQGAAATHLRQTNPAAETLFIDETVLTPPGYARREWKPLY